MLSLVILPVSTYGDTHYLSLNTDLLTSFILQQATDTKHEHTTKARPNIFKVLQTILRKKIEAREPVHLSLRTLDFKNRILSLSGKNNTLTKNTSVSLEPLATLSVVEYFRTNILK